MKYSACLPAFLLMLITNLSGCFLYSTQRQPLPETQTKTEESSQTGVQGDNIQPDWVINMPSDDTHYYGIGFVDNCGNANSCREEGEKKARTDLQKRIAVEVHSKSSLELKHSQDGDRERYNKEYKSIIRERTKKRELRDLVYKYFFSLPDKQLRVLAAMPQMDLLERKLSQCIDEKIRLLTSTSIQTGSFVVKGEDSESLLSFYTGQFLSEKLSAESKKDVYFTPQNIGENKEDYFSRLSKDLIPLLWGEYMDLESEIKLTVRLSRDNKNQTVCHFKIPKTELVIRLLEKKRISITDADELEKKWNKILFAHIENPENQDVDSERMVALFRESLEEGLEEKGFKILNKGIISELGKNKTNELLTRIKGELEGLDKTILIALSLHGEIKPYDGFAYKGIVKVYLTITAYNPDGERFLIDRYTAKRFLVDRPDGSQSIIRGSYLKTLNKGLDEYGDEIIGKIYESIAKKSNRLSGTRK